MALLDLYLLQLLINVVTPSDFSLNLFAHIRDLRLPPRNRRELRYYTAGSGNSLPMFLEQPIDSIFVFRLDY